VIVFHANNRDKFLNDWIYIGLFSLTGCSLNVNVSFMEEVKVKKGKIVNGQEMGEEVFT
jgi:hypothetical protein